MANNKEARGKEESYREDPVIAALTEKISLARTQQTYNKYVGEVAADGRPIWFLQMVLAVEQARLEFQTGKAAGKLFEYEMGIGADDEKRYRCTFDGTAWSVYITPSTPGKIGPGVIARSLEDALWRFEEPRWYPPGQRTFTTFITK